MDADIAAAKEADREARTATAGGEEERKREATAKRKALNRAKKTKRDKIKGWENTWFVDLGDRATQAAKVNDQGELYRVLKELKVRGQMGGRDGGSRTAADPEEEREAWKDYFRKVSEGRGVVADKV